MKSYSSSDLIEMAGKAGWIHIRTKGSHHSFRHPVFRNTVIIPHPKKNLFVGTVKSILKQIEGNL